MHMSKRGAVAITVVAMCATGVPAFAGGHGGSGGGGGGGGPGTKPYIQFKAGGAYNVTEGATNAIIQVERVPKGADSVYFSTNGSPNGAVGVTPANGCSSDPAADYVVQTNQVVNIGTNGIGTATVPICDNTFFEHQDTVNLVLSQRPTFSPVAKFTAILLINDNDKAPVLSVNNRTGAEGTTQTFTVTASSANPLLSMSFHWATSDGTATVADGDYATQSGDGSIAPGATTTTFDVTSLNDNVFEPGTDEYLRVNLSAPVNSSISSTAGSGKDNLQDINSPPTLSVNDVTDWEGNTIGFTVTRTGMTTGAVTFDWTTAADGDATATGFGPNNVCGVNSNDYVSTAANDVSIAAGGATGTATLSVPTCDDLLQEDNETFHVYLSDPNFATISDGTGVGTIRDNEPFNTTVTTDAPGGTATQGTMVTETATVTNKNGDPLPGITVRGEVWRDEVDFFVGDELDGTFVVAGSVITDANGQITGGPYSYTGGAFGDVADFLYVCIDGYDGATAGSCNVDLGSEGGDPEELLKNPTGTLGMATVIWTP